MSHRRAVEIIQAGGSVICLGVRRFIIPALGVGGGGGYPAAAIAPLIGGGCGPFPPQITNSTALPAFSIPPPGAAPFLGQPYPSATSANHHRPPFPPFFTPGPVHRNLLHGTQLSSG